VLPAVVNISTTQTITADSGDLQEFEDLFRDFFDKQNPNRPQGPRRSTSLGSGFIIDPDGYIVTNNHVVSDAEEVTVRLYDDTNLKAEIVGRDEKTDLALLKVDARQPLPFVKWGDSDTIRIGDWVVAIGNPFGLGGSVTAGIVSARQREINAGPYDDFIQTDASINPGNSGGPLVDSRGALIGINTAIFSQTGGSVGIGFAIPVNIAKDVLPQLRVSGKVVRGYLGVAVMPVSPEVQRALKLPAARGALVAEVVPRSPAASAGLTQGDVITSLQDVKIQSPTELTRRVAGTPPGTPVRLQVARKDGEHTMSVALGRLRDEPTSEDR